MKASEAFINVTLFSYVACIFLTVIGRTPVLNSSPIHQITGYLLAIAFIIASIKMKETPVRNFCGAAYGFAAMVTFAGSIQWVGGVGACLAMAVWDLVLGVTILTNDV